MSIVGIMPIHGRPGITRETLLMLKKTQTLPFTEIIVMGGPEDEAPAKDAGCDFLTVQNEPLGRKYECGMAWAMTYDPEAVAILGSDTWLSPKWLELTAMEIVGGADLVGKIDWYSLHATKKGGIREIRHMGYKEGTYARETPVGGGRLISRRLLDRMGWHVYPITQNTALDTYSFHRMAQYAPEVVILEGDVIKVMGIKGPWESLNRFSRLKRSPHLDHLGQVREETIPNWMDMCFPGGREAIERALK